MEIKNELITQDVNVTLENFTEVGKLSYKYNDVTEKIKDSIKDIFDNFLLIATKLYIVKRDELYKIVGYKDIYDYSINEFDLVKTTVKNLVSIADKFCERTEVSPGVYEIDKCLKDEYKDFGYSQLVELLSVSKIDLNNYSPSMSVREIRENKIFDKLMNCFNGFSNIKDDKSLIKLCLNYIIDTYRDEYNLSYKTRFDDNSYCVESCIYFNINKESLFSLGFEFVKYRSILTMSIRPQNWNFMNSYGYKEFNTFEEFKILIDECFNIYNNLKIKEDEKVSKVNNDDVIEAVVTEEIVAKEEIVLFTYDEFVDKNQYDSIVKAILVPFKNSIKDYKFYYDHNYDYDLNIIIDEETTILIVNESIESKINYFKNDKLIKTFDFKDVFLMALNSIGQTSDQVNINKSEIFIDEDGNERCCKCNTLLSDSLYANNYCSFCGSEFIDGDIND